MTDIDRLRLAIDKWGQALIMEIQWLREAIVAQNISICESCANNPCNKKAMLGDRRIYECTMYERAEQTEPQTSCKTCRYGEVDEGYVRCAYYSKSTEQDEPQTEKPKIRKRIDKPFRAVWLDDDHNEIGTPQTDCSWK